MGLRNRSPSVPAAGAGAEQKGAGPGVSGKQQQSGESEELK